MRQQSQADLPRRHTHNDTTKVLPPGMVGPTYIGALAPLLPFIEQAPLHRQITNLGYQLKAKGTGPPHPTAGRPFFWWEDVNMRNIAAARLSIFECPSDSAESRNGVFVYFYTQDYTLYGGVFTGLNAGRTNYVASAGALGKVPDSFWGKYYGPFFKDSTEALHRFPDGASNTFLFGEYLGDATNGTAYSASWMGAGNMATAWDIYEPGAWHTFGSKHTGVVLFGFGDGSVRLMRKRGADTDWYTADWYAFQRSGGLADGESFSFQNLE